MRRFFESFIFIFIFWASIILVWYLGFIYDFWFRFWWFDIPLHFSGGLWSFVAVSYTLRKFNIVIEGSRKELVSFILLISSIALIGVVWEFAELIFDRYVFRTGFTFLPGVFEDTLLDLLMDILGGIIGFVFYKKR